MTDRLKQLQSMLENDPEDSFLLYACAKEYENIENIEKALEIYLYLQEIDPQYIGLYYHLGKLYEDIGDNKKAVDTYNLGINMAKKLSDFHALSELNTAKTNLELEM